MWIDPYYYYFLRSRQRLEAEPYSWKRYDIGSYEYDMIVYRRRRNCFQTLFDC